jgi:hypothetical protein
MSYGSPWDFWKKMDVSILWEWRNVRMLVATNFKRAKDANDAPKAPFWNFARRQKTFRNLALNELVKFWRRQPATRPSHTGCSTITDHFFITHFSYECFYPFLTSNSDLESWDHSLSAYRFTFLKKHRKTQKTGREKTAYYLMFF